MTIELLVDRIYGCACECYGYVNETLDAKMEAIAADFASLLKTPGMDCSDPQAVIRSVEKLRAAWLILQGGRLVKECLTIKGQRHARSAALAAQTLADRLLFGSRLHMYRRKKHLTISGLAAAVGVDRSYVSKLESAAAGPPSLDVVARFAEVLDVHLPDLLQEAIGPLTFAAETRAYSGDGVRASLISDIAEACESIPDHQLRMLLAQTQAVAGMYRHSYRQEQTL